MRSLFRPKGLYIYITPPANYGREWLQSASLHEMRSVGQ